MSLGHTVREDYLSLGIEFKLKVNTLRDEAAQIRRRVSDGIQESSTRMKGSLIKMMRIMSLMILAWPVVAQINQALPSPSTKIADLATAPAPSRTRAWMKDLDRTRNQERTLYRWSVATVVAVNAADVL